MSHDLLDDLLADVPRHVDADPAAAWRAGTQRRRRTYVVEALATAAAVVLVGLGLVQLHDRTPVQPSDKTVKVDGYPSSVGWPRGRPELPDRPGPMAGVIAWSTGSDDGWAVIDATGRSWDLPGGAGTFTPTLSDDGRWLGFLRSEGEGDSTFVFRDLVSADEVEFPELGSNVGLASEPYMLMDAPGFWSPADDAVVVEAVRRPKHGVRPLLLTKDGGISELDVPGKVAGWAGPDRLVWVRDNGAVSFTDRHGEVLDGLQLSTTTGSVGYDGVRVSPDGSELAVIDLGPDVVNTYSLASGELEDTAPLTYGTGTSPGPPVWQGERVLTVYEGLVDASRGRNVVTLGDHWPMITGSRWAADALDGPAHGGPPVWEWRYWWVVWWWQQALMVLGAVLVGWLIWWWSGRDLKKRAGHA